MDFLTNMIGIIEMENQMDGDAYWWIGNPIFIGMIIIKTINFLNYNKKGVTDHAEEGTWVWPSGIALAH